MNQRIAYLKRAGESESPETEAYCAFFKELSQNEYEKITADELWRKVHFLKCFAEKAPVVMDRQELLVGNLSFWKGRKGARNKGHIIVDYRMILREGIPGIRQKIAGICTEEGKAFSESLEAFALFVERHGKATEKAGMTEVADNCFALTKQAPKTFYQALQLVWFIHVFLHVEGMAAAVSFGRFDAYMYPFYRNDIENGILTREQAKELLMCFWLKCCEGDESQNLTLGGDVENDLTFLCMEVTCELKVKQPSVSVRTHEHTSEALWDKIIELIKCKIGMPAIFNDPVVVKALERTGVESADAANYAIVGCYEANSDGNTFGTTASAGNIYLIDELMEFLNQEDEYKDFISFYDGFRKFFAQKYETVILERFRKSWLFIREHLVSPFESICMEGCLESGFHLQINVTDAETLKRAKENPQEYSDLVVRISGYSEHFVKLDEVIQNALIERN